MSKRPDRFSEADENKKCACDIRYGVHSQGCYCPIHNPERSHKRIKPIEDNTVIKPLHERFDIDNHFKK